MPLSCGGARNQVTLADDAPRLIDEQLRDRLLALTGPDTSPAAIDNTR